MAGVPSYGAKVCGGKEPERDPALMREAIATLAVTTAFNWLMLPPDHAAGVSYALSQSRPIGPRGFHPWPWL
ncbi:hypothetical protein AA0311_1782 [Asaia bogorensis NBRC 16594]|uniref:Uncharacterized protein n=1 Tax=Asaia bogorensis NBRC 16594 TaxID=1231624 RepID=A0AAN4R2Q8_9PROT|nr:hypothetical protein AA0311_1782 [Asaia bogorensis NBRC 16594]GEL53961.1 hypothetical protein ABO01nite_19680 [Asaia bogorensis NBRC 16594]